MTTNAARQPLCTAIQVASTGATICPRLDACLVDRVAQSALAGEQVLVNRLSGRWNAGGFGHAEHRAAAHQSAQPAS